jgi:hypothetical protein
MRIRSAQQSSGATTPRLLPCYFFDSMMLCVDAGEAHRCSSTLLALSHTDFTRTHAIMAAATPIHQHHPAADSTVEFKGYAAYVRLTAQRDSD